MAKCDKAEKSTSGANGEGGEKWQVEANGEGGEISS